jgi:hypothetical protein
MSASSKSFKSTAIWLSSAVRLVVIRPKRICMPCILAASQLKEVEARKLGGWSLKLELEPTLELGDAQQKQKAKNKNRSKDTTAGSQASIGPDQPLELIKSKSV